MSVTGLEVFDKTVQTTNAWLKEIMEATGLDRRRAYRALAAVLHALRDRLTVDEVAQLGAQLEQALTRDALSADSGARPLLRSMASPCR